MKKRTIAILITVVLLLSVSLGVSASTRDVPATLTYKDIRVTLDGTPLDLRGSDGEIVEPFVIDGTTYLPVRAVAGALGLGVDWDNGTNTVKLSSDGAQAGDDEEEIARIYLQDSFQGVKYYIPSVWKKTTGNDSEHVSYNANIGVNAITTISVSTVSADMDKASESQKIAAYDALIESFFSGFDRIFDEGSGYEKMRIGGTDGVHRDFGGVLSGVPLYMDAYMTFKGNTFVCVLCGIDLNSDDDVFLRFHDDCLKLVSSIDFSSISK